eukprot:CAMPEP_0206237118 /NCGR_PEP_ID=MMETSP0047_2-20121206/14090_1 /ASSEMBLY_ACC=CAM_ASM_000192 /TAXON_ID=195065 /ORGANISM="Chroomonas mesostigmatica_cf, Strain CCMP1168" /LENGTH=386 /DNA_ID=CAMNT_0053661523 /DNA_START=157 /DNA_END=1317 /DNA_ORIENTATION=-
MVVSTLGHHHFNPEEGSPTSAINAFYAREHQYARSGAKSAAQSSTKNVAVRRVQEPKLRLCTYNIHGWRDTHHADNLERLVAVLSKVNADVIALQEVLHPFRPPSSPEAAAAYFDRVKSGKGNGFKGDYMQEEDGLPYLEELAERLGMSYVSFGCATTDGYFGEFNYGNALLSKYPIVKESHHRVVPDARHQAGRRIEAEDRCISLVTVLLPGEREASFCVTHLDQLSDELRLEQVREMLAHTKGLGGHVFCGDFNVFQKSDCSDENWNAIVADAEGKGWPAPPETTAAIKELSVAGYVDSFYESDNHTKGEVVNDVQGMAGDSKHPGATCWVIKPLLRIDYTFLSRELVAAGVRVHQHQRVLDDASDHFPVVVDLSGVSDPNAQN